MTTTETKLSPGTIQNSQAITKIQFICQIGPTGYQPCDYLQNVGCLPLPLSWLSTNSLIINILNTIGFLLSTQNPKSFLQNTLQRRKTSTVNRHIFATMFLKNLLNVNLLMSDLFPSGKLSLYLCHCRFLVVRCNISKL